MRTLIVVLLSINLVIATEPIDHLTLAADHLDRGETPQAITHLTVHVRSHPDEVMSRAYLAELHFRQKNLRESQAEFEKVIAAAQGMKGKPYEHLIHCHTRLMSIAEEQGDTYREQLHRGIGLWRLVEKWNKDDTTSESTLTQALEALQQAKRARPQDARVQLYLAEVTLKLKQPDAAKVHIAAAKSAAPGGLTASEETRLMCLLNAER